MTPHATNPASTYPAAPVSATLRRRRAMSGSSYPMRRNGRRVLFISYPFPPTGGGGVQRAVKFAKYLPRCGWHPTILTVANPSVPVKDSDLANDLCPDMPVVRAKTWEPDYTLKRRLAHNKTERRASVRRWIRWLSMQVLQPDPQILWNPSALHEATRTLRQQTHDAILVTGPPFSSFLLGYKLKKRFGLPLILDFRDEWMLVTRHMENYQLSGLSMRMQRAMMRKVLRFADAVIATTQASAGELARQCRDARSQAAVVAIYNGYDPADLEDLDAEPSDRTRFRIVYTGTLWKLTNIAPFARTLQSLAHTSPDRLAHVELITAGRRTSGQDKILDELRGTGVTLVSHDYLPHRRSLELAASADLLLLLLDDQRGADRVVPAKLFEYLAIGKPILAMCPFGEASRLLDRFGRGATFRPGEIELAVQWLKARLDDFSAHGRPGLAPVPSSKSSPGLEQFSRPSLTRDLSKLLCDCTACCHVS